MNASNILLKTIIAVLLAALAGHPIAHAQSKKIRIRIESDSAFHKRTQNSIIITAKRDSINLDSVMKKMEISIKKIEDQLNEIEDIQIEIEMDENDTDTFRINLPQSPKITKIEPVTREFHHYIGFLYVQQNPSDVQTQTTTGGVITNGMPELNTAKSLHYGLEQLWGLNLIKGKLRFFTGLRYDVYNFRFQSNFVRLTENAPEFQAITVGGPTVDPIPMEKSKLVANYIGVPIGIGWQSSPGRWETSESDGSNTSYNETPKFSIKAGVHTGYRISAHTKIKESGGNTTKQYDDFNLNNFIIAPFINFEYEDLGVYMRYPLTKMLKTGQGANSQCLQFGITLKFS
jgi:hypothetical protein